MCLQLVKFILINICEQMVQLPQRGGKLWGGQQARVESLSQFVQIHHLDPAVGVDNHVCQQIRGGQSMGLFIPGILYNVTIPL